MNRWYGGGGEYPVSPWKARLKRSKDSSSVISTARPEMRASPLVTCLSSVALCSARRGSRWRSVAFLEPCIIPSQSSSSANSGSMPLMRGDPSARSVAKSPRPVDWKRSLTRSANSGAAASTSDQDATR